MLFLLEASLMAHADRAPFFRSRAESNCSVDGGVMDGFVEAGKRSTLTKHCGEWIQHLSSVLLLFLF